MKILFLCVANSARSQMAQGLARKMLGEKAQVFSAGSNPSHVHPMAIKVMQEIGIDVSEQQSQSIDEYSAQTFDQIITLCAEEVCPVFLGATQKDHWPFPDPAAAPEGELLASFRIVRDQIRDKIRELQ